MLNSHWISWIIAPKAWNVSSQDVRKFTSVSYRTSALWGRYPALTPLLQLITPSGTSGTADHVRSLDDLFFHVIVGKNVRGGRIWIEIQRWTVSQWQDKTAKSFNQSSRLKQNLEMHRKYILTSSRISKNLLDSLRLHDCFKKISFYHSVIQ